MQEQRRLASQIQFARLLQTFPFEQDSSLKIRSKRLVLQLHDWFYAYSDLFPILSWHRRIQGALASRCSNTKQRNHGCVGPRHCVWFFP